MTTMKKRCPQKGLNAMKVLIDTNVILDVLCDRKEFVHSSLQVWKNCEIGAVEGCVSAMSIPNIIYILRKELS